MKRTVPAFLLLACIPVMAMSPNPAACWRGVDSISGTYVISYKGFLTVPSAANPYSTPTLFPGAILGVMSIDSQGNLKGTATVAGLTSVADYVTTGKLRLNPDCTGIMTMTSTDRKTGYTEEEEDRFIAISDDNDVELRVLISKVSPGIVPVVLGKWKRISPAPNAVVW